MIVLDRSMKRVHLVISGDVVGVGFRAWIRDLAEVLHLTGWVKNRQDHTVEIVAEGKPGDIETLVKRCGRGPRLAVVKHVAEEYLKDTDELIGFEVLY